MEKKKLQTFRREIEEFIARTQPDTEAALEQLQEPGTELSNAPMHLGDRGTEEFQRDLNVTILENERQRLEEAFAALQRTQDGTYGSCERCGRAIPDERLHAIPFTRYCTDCAAIETKTGPNLNEGRPRSPADTLAGRDVRPDARLDDDELTPGMPRKQKGMAAATDIHAAGTPGGGTAFGGLAGSNVGDGEPRIPALEAADGSGNVDAMEDRDTDPRPKSGQAGGAVGGTPARKRTSGNE